MLKSWSVHNFKAIVDSGELQLAPVTVLAGLNSSGKTSFLQSLLMVAQTLGSRLIDHPLLPNERIVQLGTLGDILTTFSQEDVLRIGFEAELEVEEEEEFFDIDDEWIVGVYRDLYAIKMNVTFRRLHQKEREISAIEASKVLVEKAIIDITCRTVSPVSQARPIHHTFSYHTMTDDELSLFLQHVKPDTRRLLPSPSGQPSYFGSFASSKEHPSTSYLLALSHFLPTRLVKKFREREQLQEEIISELSLLLDSPNFRDTSFSFISPTAQLSEGLRTAMGQICQSYSLLIPFEGTSLLDVGIWMDALKEKGEKTLNRAEKSLYRLIAQDLLANRGDEQSELLTTISEFHKDGQMEYLVRATDCITNFFSRNIRYLGPLRADPGTIQQQFAPTGNLDEVGAKGEYAATVYHYNQHALLDYYHPVRGEIEQATLQEALDTWARYLGVAHQVRTDLAGVSGMTWKVYLKSEQHPRALPQVGVGTSQILPLLVMGLLSPKQSLLVIEQPELHLHPRIQSRLGDFFLGLARCQKQCLIETHSENLVNQLRHHIVQSEGQEKSDCALYFAQQDEQGATSFEPIRVSARGNILNWPEGFFDETLLQQEQITEAYLRQEAERRKHEKYPG